MRTLPIPDDVPGSRVTLGAEPQFTPVEYAVTASTIYPGGVVVRALIELDDAERQRIAAGATLWLTLDGGELPWSLDVNEPTT